MRPEPAAAGEERVRTYWCARHACENHGPRRSAGIPLGWMRLNMGLSGGRQHVLTFCSLECLRAELERNPDAFKYDPRIDTARRRIEAAKARKQRQAPPAAAEALSAEPSAPAAATAAQTAPTAPQPATSALLPPTACPRCGVPKLVRAFATVWSCEDCGAQVKRALPRP
jgi:hypothetical protein